MRDHEPVVELPLRLLRPPALARLEERGDRVLVAVDVAGLQPHDERDRHALGGRRRVDLVGRRGVLRVVRAERAAVVVRVRPGQRGAVPRGPLREVEEPVGDALVALGVPGAGLTGPWLDLRAGEDGAADRVIRHVQACRAAAADARRERHPAHPQAAHAAVQAPRAGAAQRARDVAVPGGQAQARGADAARQLDADERIAAGHEVGAVRQDLDLGRRHACLGRDRRQQSAGASGQRKSRSSSASHERWFYQTGPAGRAGFTPFRRPPLVAWCRQGRRRPA